MKKVLLVLSFAFVLALSSKAVMPAQAYAAENLEPGGTNYSNAEQLLVGKQYTGTALRQGDGRCWYEQSTNENCISHRLPQLASPPPSGICRLYAPPRYSTVP